MADYQAILLVLALFSTLYYLPKVRLYFVRRKAIREHGCEPLRALPSKDPWFGLDVAMRMFRSYSGGQRSLKFKEQHDTYGATFQSVALGKTRIFTCDPTNLRSVFNTDFQSWGVQPLRLPPWGPMLGAGVMDTDGTFWKHSRGMVQPLFRKEQIERIEDLSSFDLHVSRLIDLIPRDGSTVDLQPLFARLLLDFTTEFLFGDSVACLTPTPNREAMEFLEAFHDGQAGIGKRTQLPMLTVFTMDKRFAQACGIVQRFVERYVDKALARHQRQNLSLDPDEKEEMMQQKRSKYVLADELAKISTDRLDMRNQLLNTFLAAHDTTAVLMTNTMFNLARNPRVYAKLRAEVLSAGHTTSESLWSHIKSLPYLRHVVTETSRLTPVVGQSARIALKDTVLPTGGGDSGLAPVHVRKGVSVQLNYVALHRRPEVYGPDADVFRPERWETLRVGTWDFLPFIGGPRVCPAQQMALTQVAYTVARIACEFESVENRDPVLEFVEQYRITSDSKNGCKVALVPA